MDVEKQKKIQENFEKMFQDGQKPWVDIGMEPALDKFFQVLSSKYPNAKILDIGCGDGWISIRAAREGFETWGIDSSETAIKEATDIAKEAEVNKATHFKVGDALNLPYEDNFFDALIDRGLFHHVLPENRSLYFQNILRVLKQRSSMYLHVFSTKNERSMGQLFTPEMIQELFGSDFTIIFSDEDPYPPKGYPVHLLHFIMERK